MGRKSQLRLKISGWIFIALAAITVAFFLYLPDWTRVKQLRLENARINKDIKNMKGEIRDIKSSMKRLKTTPSFWESLARENMGVIKKDEILVDIKHKRE